MKLKKIIAAMLTAALTLSVAACGNGGSTTTESTQAPSNQQGTTDTPKPNNTGATNDEIIIGTFELNEGNNTILISGEYATSKINVNFRALGIVASANAEISLV